MEDCKDCILGIRHATVVSLQGSTLHGHKDAGDKGVHNVALKGVHKGVLSSRRAVAASHLDWV